MSYDRDMPHYYQVHPRRRRRRAPHRPGPQQHPPKPQQARPSQTEAHDNPIYAHAQLDRDMDTYIRLPYT